MAIRRRDNITGGSADAPTTSTDHPRKHTHHRKPKPNLALALFGMPLGLVALGAAWASAQELIGGPQWMTEVLYASSAVLWAVFSALYLWRGVRARGSFTMDRNHPVSGPLAAYIPLIAVLLFSHYTQYVPVVGTWLTVASIAALGIVGAQLAAFWLSGGVSMNTVHGGYFIPVVAGANIASIGFAEIGARDAAIAAFGAGLFFWVVMGTVVIVRLMTSSALPVPLKPTLTAFLAAAATSNLGWILTHPGRIDELQLILTGVLVMMVLIQVALLGEYRQVRFNDYYWVFTFPLASTANYAIHGLTAAKAPGAAMWAWGILVLVTAFIVAVAGRSVQQAISARWVGIRSLTD